MKIQIEEISLPLKVLWKLSRNETNHKTNYILKIKDEGEEFLGEVAPNIRYGETPEKILYEFEHFHDRGFTDFQELSNYLDKIEISNSLRFGVESAYLHYFAFKEGKTVANYLGLKEIDQVETSLSIPIMEPSQISEHLSNFDTHNVYKLKVSHDSAPDLIRETLNQIQGKPLRVDANEGWTNPDELLKLMESFKNQNIELIEQPFAADKIDEYKYFFKHTPFEVMADESIEDTADFSELKKQFHWINIKLMKTGSYLKAIELTKRAHSHGLKSMIGCMIETSVGIESALNIASLFDIYDLDGALLLKEDPYKKIHYQKGFVIRS
jgi:L-alanine-DL-glutamate epimerase-like enolase superfamily enzyme